MEEKRIGEWIQRLRKQKGVTQQELANALGVTTQAVSKWENGGTPDAQLLPAIADFFLVSIDVLFGRESKRGESVAQEIINELANMPEEQRVQQAYEYCWAMQVGLCGELLGEFKEQGPPKIKAEQEYYSRILQNGGMTEMKVNEDGHYFFLLEEAEKNNASLLAEVSAYKTLFQTLAEENTLAVLLFLYQRKDIGFTCELLADKLGQPIEQVKKSIASLQKRQFLECFEVETAEGILATYKVRMNSALLPFLLFAKEMIAPPEYMYLQLIKREKPLL